VRLPAGPADSAREAAPRCCLSIRTTGARASSLRSFQSDLKLPTVSVTPVGVASIATGRPSKLPESLPVSGGMDAHSDPPTGRLEGGPSKQASPGHGWPEALSAAASPEG